MVSFGLLKTFAVPRDPSPQVDMTLKALKTEFKSNVTVGSTKINLTLFNQIQGEIRRKNTEIRSWIAQNHV